MAFLEGKCALVTGGSRGIGRGIALRLAERGARVAINYVRDEAAAKQTLAAIRERGASGFIVRADVSKPDEVMAMAARVEQEFGKLDILVNNALGNLLGFFAPPQTVSMEQWDEAFQCQPRAFFSVVRAMSPLLQDRGRIIAISFWPGSQRGGFQPVLCDGGEQGRARGDVPLLRGDVREARHHRKRRLCRDHGRQHRERPAEGGAGRTALLAA